MPFGARGVKRLAYARFAVKFAAPKQGSVMPQDFAKTVFNRVTRDAGTSGGLDKDAQQADQLVAKIIADNLDQPAAGKP
jgi:hypothetical protein